jgi:hypothetical protein
MLCSGIGPSRRDCFHLPEQWWLTPIYNPTFPTLLVRMGPNTPIPWHIQHSLEQVTQKETEVDQSEPAITHSPVHDEGWMVSGYERVFWLGSSSLVANHGS